MKTKNDRMEALKRIISGKALGSQEEVLAALAREGYVVTQATLSRDLKRLKVAKAADMDGRYVYVLPNETMYRRVHSQRAEGGTEQLSGCRSVSFSGNIGVIRTRPGYASAVACNIDNAGLPEVLGTVAGHDTVVVVVRENAAPDAVAARLAGLAQGME